MERRDFLTGLAVAPLAAALNTAPTQAQAQPSAAARPRVPIKQSVMASVWGADSKLSFEQRCQALQRLGFKGVDLPTPEQAPMLKKYGLTPAMMTGAGTSFQDGLIRKELHDKFEAAFKTGIDTCAAVGCPNLIAMPGERRGMPREETIANTVAILNRVKGYAEQKGVTLCMEITNSKVVADQRTDQTFNRLDWGWEVCRRVASPRVKREDRLRHLPRADHGRRYRPEPPRQPRLHLPHPRGRRAEPPGDRRHAGAELPLHRQRHRRLGLHGLRGARVAAGPRP
jgi:hydroxypyruvate isomerase